MLLEFWCVVNRTHTFFLLVEVNLVCVCLFCIKKRIKRYYLILNADILAIIEVNILGLRQSTF